MPKLLLEIGASFKIFYYFYNHLLAWLFYIIVNQNFLCRLDKLSTNASEIDANFAAIEKDVDALRTALYAPFKPELKFLEPIRYVKIEYPIFLHLVPISCWTVLTSKSPNFVEFTESNI